MNLIEALNWRYATKAMNGNSIPQEKVDTILEAARLAPTGGGLQPFEIISVSNKEWKEKIFPVAYNQQPIIGSSHLLVFAAWDLYTEERIREFFDRTATERNLPKESMAATLDRMLGHFTNLTPEQQFQHASKQAGIGLGLAVAAAAMERVDATPMEGFNGPELDELLGLTERGLKSTLLLALGQRDEVNDWAVNLKKIRRPKSAFVTELY